MPAHREGSNALLAVLRKSSDALHEGHNRGFRCHDALPALDAAAGDGGEVRLGGDAGRGCGALGLRSSTSGGDIGGDGGGCKEGSGGGEGGDAVEVYLPDHRLHAR